MRSRGIACAIAAAVSYGMNPLFAVPLYRLGYTPDGVLFFRYCFAAVLLGVWCACRKKSLKVSLAEFGWSSFAGLLFAISSLSLFAAYLKMDAGIASTLLFVYPVMVAVIMAICFHERLSWITCCCIALSSLGIALLGRNQSGQIISVAGIAFVMVSAISYAVYLVSVNRSRMRTMPAEKLTFYVLLSGAIFFWVRLRFGFALRGDFCPQAWCNIAGLALICAILSMVCTNLALQTVGATVTAIFGALEPVTAVFCGVTVLGETLTRRILLGIVLILAAVILITLQNSGKPSAAPDKE